MKRVEVQWEDICTHAGWCSPDTDFAPTYITQVGYVKRKTAKYLELVSSFTPHNEVGDVTKIPLGLVRRIKRI